ncbi:hypothetical protein CRENBAI_022212 [Crenichthys baileyi]|uniref:Uncharacterized protein n=1 Tax=Crenichthys baileyi TaxID=28760 RepID=A0AAV9RBM8_9TELE
MGLTAAAELLTGKTMPCPFTSSLQTGDAPSLDSQREELKHVDDEEEEEETSYPEAPNALERGRGRGKSQPSENRSCSSRFTGKQVIVDRTCHKAYHSSTGQIES